MELEPFGQYLYQREALAEEERNGQGDGSGPEEEYRQPSCDGNDVSGGQRRGCGGVEDHPCTCSDKQEAAGQQGQDPAEAEVEAAGLGCCGHDVRG